MERCSFQKVKTFSEFGDHASCTFADASATNQCYALIDLYGTRGGINEHRAALMASHGYASLSLAYFRYKDLPPTLDSVLDLEYFEVSIDSRPKYDG